MYKSFFAPASALLNRFRYAVKFIVIGLVVAIPFGIVSYLQVSAAGAQVDFAEKELAGHEYNVPMIEFIQGLQDQRTLLCAKLAGEKTVPCLDKKTLKNIPLKVDKAIEDTKTAVDVAVKKVFEADKKYGTLFKTTEKWNQYAGEWNALKAKEFKSDDKSAAMNEVIAVYTELIKNATDLMNDEIIQKSLLILDPELDSYYLVDERLVKMQNIAETVSKITAQAVAAGSSGKLNGDSRDEIIAGLYNLKNLVSDVRSDIEAVYAAEKEKRNDETVKTALEQRIAAFEAVTPTFIDDIDKKFMSHIPKLVSGGVNKDTEISVADILNASQTYLAALRPMDEPVNNSLQRIITLRRDQYAAQKRNGYILTGITAFLLLYIFAGFFISVQGSIVTLGQFTTRMITGTTETFKLDAKDELANVAESYNQINAALVEARNLKDKIEKENSQLQGNILDLLSVVADAADGDMTVRAKVTEGSLGNMADALNQMFESLSDVLKEIKRVSKENDLAIGNIRAASENMTLGANEQANELGVATKAIEEMSNSIQNVSSNAETAATAAKRTQDAALAGSESVQNVVRGMETLRANVQAGAKKIKNLGDRSMEITSIVATIAKISDQTNMLALNAAIEAARAGEHGRGFSVVADEVRKLAERTANATQEIEKLVKDIQAQTNESVAAIEQQTQVVEEEARTVSEAGETLNKILDESSQSSELIGEINKASQAQVKGAGAVVSLVGHVSEIASQTKSGAGNTLKAAEDLAGLSSQMLSTINKFKIGE